MKAPAKRAVTLPAASALALTTPARGDGQGLDGGGGVCSESGSG